MSLLTQFLEEHVTRQRHEGKNPRPKNPSEPVRHPFRLPNKNTISLEYILTKKPQKPDKKEPKVPNNHLSASRTTKIVQHESFARTLPNPTHQDVLAQGGALSAPVEDNCQVKGSQREPQPNNQTGTGPQRSPGKVPPPEVVE